MTLYNCSNVDMHGPFEQTWINDQLDFTQGRIVGVDEDNLLYTVEVLLLPSFPATVILSGTDCSISLCV
jgi:hypothetical protein